MNATMKDLDKATWKTLLGRPELVLVALMAIIIAMLVVPMPTVLIDLLIALNMALAIVIFLSSFYVERLLSFSTFPSVLLLTTLLRLALSVSTSRLILVDADAGHIIQAFGDFVIADNLVVGFVVFSIVTIVQFIVITKGAERVGEVTARFSLDGMPGKQMSIDADLRAGSIDGAEAQVRRREVERESQLYGSFDGAMKFVKGDAIAGIVILLVNLFGGITVGMMQHGMTFAQAVQTFTLLTIGDGLVAQIPALLICISAGFIVTRVSGESRNLGEGIIGELFHSNNVVVISSVLVLALGMLPGFPLPVFAVLSAGLFMVWFRRRKGRGSKSSGGVDTDTAGREKSEEGSLDDLGADALPLLLMMSPALLKQWNAQGWQQRMLEAFVVRLGLRLPPLAAREGHAESHEVNLLINELSASRSIVVAGQQRILSPEDHHLALPGVSTIKAPGHSVSLWVAAGCETHVKALGSELRTDFDELFLFVRDAVVRHISELFGVQETKHMMDKLETRYPELVKETYRHLPVQRLAEVMQRLLQENISIRHARLILETLSQWSQREKDVLMLVEHVRGAMARYISASVAVDGRIAAAVFTPEAEELIRGGVRQSQGASFLNLDPAAAEDLLQRITLHVGEVAAYRPGTVLLVAPDLRRFVKRFIETRLPETQVISFSEISSEIQIDVVRTI